MTPSWKLRSRREGNSGAEIQVETGSRTAGQEFDVLVDLSFALGVPRP